ncbi:LOW QUALITY PROTEIN: hypothetical protein ColTof4_12219 [Colletotrichum tofieldiae]|nr:LOW QUALITY PROTEIN: hypothetical protein ColTof3_05629 [Colletotrichum tofieldiae]GKT79797.1 LOW QUALITY PROTEIN: hypothetical protein ColTof4_12219 [Colletotrichum tofieldiae]
MVSNWPAAAARPSLTWARRPDTWPLFMTLKTATVEDREDGLGVLLGGVLHQGAHAVVRDGVALGGVDAALDDVEVLFQVVHDGGVAGRAEGVGHVLGAGAGGDGDVDVGGHPSAVVVEEVVVDFVPGEERQLGGEGTAVAVGEVERAALHEVEEVVGRDGAVVGVLRLHVCPVHALHAVLGDAGVDAVARVRACPALVAARLVVERVAVVAVGVGGRAEVDSVGGPVGVGGEFIRRVVLRVAVRGAGTRLEALELLLAEGLEVLALEFVGRVGLDQLVVVGREVVEAHQFAGVVAAAAAAVHELVGAEEGVAVDLGRVAVLGGIASRKNDAGARHGPERVRGAVLPTVLDQAAGLEHVQESALMGVDNVATIGVDADSMRDEDLEVGAGLLQRRGPNTLSSMTASRITFRANTLSEVAALLEEEEEEEEPTETAPSAALLTMLAKMPPPKTWRRIGLGRAGRARLKADGKLGVDLALADDGDLGVELRLEGHKARLRGLVAGDGAGEQLLARARAHVQLATAVKVELGRHEHVRVEVAKGLLEFVGLDRADQGEAKVHLVLHGPGQRQLQEAGPVAALVGPVVADDEHGEVVLADRRRARLAVVIAVLAADVVHDGLPHGADLAPEARLQMPPPPLVLGLHNVRVVLVGAGIVDAEVDVAVVVTLLDPAEVVAVRELPDAGPLRRSLDHMTRQRVVGLVECVGDDILGEAQSRGHFEDGALESAVVHVIAVADGRVVLHAHQMGHMSLAWPQLRIVPPCQELEVAPITLVDIGHSALGPVDDDGEEGLGPRGGVVGQDVLVKGRQVALDRRQGRKQVLQGGGQERVQVRRRVAAQHLLARVEAAGAERTRVALGVQRDLDVRGRALVVVAGALADPVAVLKGVGAAEALGARRQEALVHGAAADLVGRVGRAFLALGGPVALVDQGAPRVALAAEGLLARGETGHAAVRRVGDGDLALVALAVAGSRAAPLARLRHCVDGAVDVLVQRHVARHGAAPPTLVPELAVGRDGVAGRDVGLFQTVADDALLAVDRRPVRRLGRRRPLQVEIEGRQALARQARQRREVVVVQVDGPDHDAAQPHAVGPFDLGLQRVGIVVADPLVLLVAKHNVLGRRLLVVHHLRVLVGDDVHDLKVAERAGRVGTRALVGRAPERTSGRLAAGVFELERAAVETHAEHHLPRLDVVAPQQVGGQLDLCQVGVCLDDVANGVVLVPDAVQIVRHHVDPVGILQQAGHVKPAQIPVRRRDGEGQAVVAPRRGQKGLAQDLEHRDIALSVVLLVAAAVGRAGILPVQVDAVKAVARHELDQVVGELLALLLAGGNVREDGLGCRVVV